MITVKTEGLTKIYRNAYDVVALRDVSIEIKRGEFIAVVGPSGSGKTTLLNLIGGIDSPTSGRVWLDGIELTALKKRELSKVRLRKLGFIFQQYNLIPVLTAFENIEFPLILQGVKKEQRTERIITLLEKLGIEELANRRPPELSGGQQQRVAIARAIVTGPAVVLADEPTANLDSKTGSQIMELMRQLNENEGITFVFSTHDPMVMRFSKRIIRVHDGSVIED